MRTTIRIDDDLLKELRERAFREGQSFTQLINRTIRRGLNAPDDARAKRGRYREKPISMGTPRIHLDKALAQAAAMEDGGAVDKLAQRK
jgi:hypothetical protein